MFTGIIGELGKVKNIKHRSGGARLSVECGPTAHSVDIGDSVSVNGVCLSVVEKGACLAFDVVGNTLSATNLKRLKSGDKVNLENALKVGDDISGHMVSGHVDGERRIKKNRKTAAGWEIDVELAKGDQRYLREKGSVAVDGVSLTVGKLDNNSFRIYLIPHTLDNTTLVSRKTGDRVNVEFDMAARYQDADVSEGAVSRDMLRRAGFI